MNYTEANTKLTGRNRERRKLANNTYLERRGDNQIAIRLHNTDIITYDSDGTTTIDVGNWITVTTKERLNRYLEGYGIHQERGTWYVVKYNSDKWERVGVYHNGMQIDPEGRLVGAETLGKAKENTNLRRRVQRYAAGFVQAMKAGKVSAPGAGDCFYCGLRTDKGETLGEVNGSDHLESHLEEKYYVPSLLARSLEVMPSSVAMKDTVYRCWQEKNCKGWGDWVWTQIQKNLSRYILRQMGQVA